MPYTNITDITLYLYNALKCIIIIHICRNKFAGYLGWPKCWMQCNKHIPSSPGCPLADAAQGTVLAFWLQGCAADSTLSLFLSLPAAATNGRLPKQKKIKYLFFIIITNIRKKSTWTSERLGGLCLRKSKCSCTTFSYITGKHKTRTIPRRKQCWSLHLNHFVD